jgi:hypothetical protein
VKVVSKLTAVSAAIVTTTIGVIAGKVAACRAILSVRPALRFRIQDCVNFFEHIMMLPHQRPALLGVHSCSQVYDDVIVTFPDL